MVADYCYAPAQGTVHHDDPEPHHGPRRLGAIAAASSCRTARAERAGSRLPVLPAAEDPDCRVDLRARHHPLRDVRRGVHAAALYGTDAIVKP